MPYDVTSYEKAHTEFLTKVIAAKNEFVKEIVKEYKTNEFPEIYNTITGINRYMLPNIHNFSQQGNYLLTTIGCFETEASRVETFANNLKQLKVIEKQLLEAKNLAFSAWQAKSSGLAYAFSSAAYQKELKEDFEKKTEQHKKAERDLAELEKNPLAKQTSEQLKKYVTILRDTVDKFGVIQREYITQESDVLTYETTRPEIQVVQPDNLLGRLEKLEKEREEDKKQNVEKDRIIEEQKIKIRNMEIELYSLRTNVPRSTKKHNSDKEIIAECLSQTEMESLDKLLQKYNGDQENKSKIISGSDFYIVPENEAPNYLNNVKFDNSYVLATKQDNSATLYYQGYDVQAITVTIKNSDTFKSTLMTTMANEKHKLLTKEQIQTVITNNTGHMPDTIHHHILGYYNEIHTGHRTDYGVSKKPVSVRTKRDILHGMANNIAALFSQPGGPSGKRYLPADPAEQQFFTELASKSR